MCSLRPSVAVMGIAAGRLALAFSELKALAPSGCSSHWSYLPMSAFLIMASSPMLVLACSCTAWLLQVIRPGRETHTHGGQRTTERGERSGGGEGEERRHSEHISAKQHVDFPSPPVLPAGGDGVGAPSAWGRKLLGTPGGGQTAPRPASFLLCLLGIQKLPETPNPSWGCFLF